ncbi:MAG: hypothetical protein LUG16_07540, partial [Candidatus Gastranaerophilales bacterium]|nr:hypothetical protein [Candidatus Gastranaerophilales bacterium]
MKQVTAYVHSHWDREWYREFEDFRLRLIEVFNEVLQAIEKGELPCFYFDGQTAAIEDYLEIHSEKSDIIKKLIKEKKLRIGPFYCSADSLLVSGECLYRNLEIGINKSKELGETEFIGYLPDTFGHSKCIPYILKAFGIDKACLWRGLGDLPADLLWDNIKVTNLIQGYFQDFFNINVNAEEKSVMLKKYLDKIARKSADNVLLPIGADHLAVPDNIKEQITALNKIYTDYEIKLESPFEYFEKINKREQVSGEFLENKSNFILPGVYSSRIYIKQANAKSQWLLSRIAEPLQALGNFFYNTLDKQNEIDYAYKTLIKNHAHDSIYGCSIDKVHDEVMIRYEKVNSVANGVVKRTLRDLSSECNNLAVINLSNFDYSGCVMVRTHKKLPKWMRAVRISSEKGFCDEKLYNINEIPITEDITNIHTYLVDIHNIKAFSVHKITKSDICKETYIKFNTNFVENKHVRIEVINKKIQITDKINNKIYDDFIEITDRADIGDSYNFGALKNDSEITAELVNYKSEYYTNHIAHDTASYIV